MGRYWRLSLLCLLPLTACLANDGYAGYAGAGGRMQLMKQEHPSVRMVRETIRMDLYGDYYDVTATFIFHNSGRAVAVTMGFPEWGGAGGDGGGGVEIARYVRRSGFSRFTSWVDGKRVSTRRVLTNRQLRTDSSYVALWVKQVQFARGQTRTVRVRYRANTGRAGFVDYGDYRLVCYQFTGGNWKGKVEESRLTAVNHIPGATSFRAYLEPGRDHPLKGTRQGSTIAYTWKNWQAEGDFYLHHQTTDSRYLTWSNWRLGIPRLPATTHITVPGNIRTVDYLPAVLVSRSVPYVQLEALYEFLTADAAAQQQRMVALSWYDNTKEAELQVGTRKLRFRAGSARMQVAGADTVRLPAAAFIYPSPVPRQQCLYVPLLPTVAALGGTAQVDMTRRTATINIPVK